MDLQQYIRDTLAKSKDIYTPLQQALQTVSNPLNIVGKVIQDKYIYDPQTKRSFPSSPYWSISDANSIQDPTKRSDALKNAMMNLTVAGSTGDANAVNNIEGAQAARSIIKPIDMGPSVESMAENAGGWKPGMRQQFDQALYSKDADAIKKMLPDVPPEYAQRFAKNIQDIVGAPPIHPMDQQAMTNYIDSVRLKQPDPNLHMDALNIADHYGLPMPKTPNGIANIFDDALARLRSTR